MDKIPPFSAEHLEAACKVLADTNRGLATKEIGKLFKECDLEDVSPEKISWKRLFNALAKAQNEHHVGDHLITFVNHALNKASYARNKEKFVWRRNELNVILSFSGFDISNEGKVVRASVESNESNLKEAYERSDTLREALENRGAHPEILMYCRAELLEENYFPVVLEAIKGVEKRIKSLSGLTTDGTGLVYTTFSAKAPVLALNSLKTKTEENEQLGFGNILVGIFGAVRNPTDNDPDITWPMAEQDALDILSLVSFVHRKLDGSVKT